MSKSKVTIKRNGNGQGIKLRLDPRNAKLHSDRNRAAIAKSLDSVGAGRGILADADGIIRAGNGIYEDWQARGGKIKVVPTDGKTLVVTQRTDLRGKAAIRAAALDNIVSDSSAYAYDADILAAIAADDDLVAALIAEDEHLAELLRGEPQAESADAGELENKADALKEKWGTATGQIWQLGAHRLAIGDCTDKATVDALMQGEKCGAVVTDSPYGIDREGIANDDPEGLRKLFDGCLAVMPIENAVIINFQSPRLFPVWLDAIRAAGHKFERMLWMYDENDQTKPWHYWLMCSQAIVVSSFGKPEWAKCQAHHDSYVIGLSREFRAGGDANDFAHASVKPLGVVADLLAHTCGDVYEPFTGSGTTLIGCENLGRKCFAVELTPTHAAVTLERWSLLTGLTPQRVAS